MKALRNIVRVLRVMTRGREHRFDLVRALARRPALLFGTGAAELAGFVSTRVPTRLKMLAEIRVASIVGCEYCLDIGAALAEYEQLVPRQISELHVFEESDAYTDEEKLVLRFATALSERSPVITPALREELAARFSKAQMVELSAAIAREHERTRLYMGIDIPPSRFASETACPIPRTAQ